MTNHKIFIVINEDLFFLTHRKNLGLYLINKGWTVFILAARTNDKYVDEIQSYGFIFIDIPFERSGYNIFHEIKTIHFLIKAQKENRPSVVMNVGLKAILWGGLMAKLCKLPVISAVSGLGYLFINQQERFKQRLLFLLFRCLLPSKRHHIVFQNEEDKEIFLSHRIISEKDTSVIKGMGVNLNEYKPLPFVDKPKIQFLLPGRMLADKGVIEFIEAAKKVSEKYNNASFVLAGNIDKKNPAGISEKQLSELIDGSDISWIGYQKNMIPVYEKSDVVVLPSYREGFPKVLIEASAIGRPVITTDVAGCKDTVKNGFNGFLVPVKNVEILAQSIEKFLEFPDLKFSMGKNSEIWAKENFDCEKVNEAFHQILKQLSLHEIEKTTQY
jgi:glycosyltransferase involved in cell wall biosynthesis